MEKLLCKLIAVFFSIGLAVSAQAIVIVKGNPNHNLIFKSDYFPLDKANSEKGGHYTNRQENDEQLVSGKGEGQHNAKLNAGRFSDNLLSIFHDEKTAEKPIYDNSFVNEAREFERERFTFNLDNSSAAGNLLDRVKINTHVPESTSIMLLTIGLFSLAMARRRMKA